MEHFFCPNAGEDPKKRSPRIKHFFPKFRIKTKKKGLHQNWNTGFSRNQVDTYAQMHIRVKLLGGEMQM